ncbi:hypothetical protein, partial [Streptomyces resistomycificus]|uniref:hypothetical protein n=1 Tax=Streptomyces resistomycificus TaxID=67356 RepID=UPI001ADF5528
NDTGRPRRRTGSRYSAAASAAWAFSALENGLAPPRQWAAHLRSGVRGTRLRNSITWSARGVLLVLMLMRKVALWATVGC